MHTISPPMTSREKQIIIGTILGGSSIIKPSKGKHCYLAMRGKLGAWLEHKAFQLSKFATEKPFSIEKTNRWHSLCYPIFDEFRANFYYRDKRRLKIEQLEGLHDIALAIWYGDAGKFHRGQVILNTHIWGEKGTKVFRQYFELIDYSAELFKERGRSRLRLDEESSRKFIKLVCPHLPLFMSI